MRILPKFQQYIIQRNIVADNASASGSSALGKRGYKDLDGNLDAPYENSILQPNNVELIQVTLNQIIYFYMKSQCIFQVKNTKLIKDNSVIFNAEGDDDRDLLQQLCEDHQFMCALSLAAGQSIYSADGSACFQFSPAHSNLHFVLDSFSKFIFCVEKISCDYNRSTISESTWLQIEDALVSFLNVYGCRVDIRDFHEERKDVSCLLDVLLDCLNALDSSKQNRSLHTVVVRAYIKSRTSKIPQALIKSYYKSRDNLSATCSNMSKLIQLHLEEGLLADACVIASSFIYDDLIVGNKNSVLADSTCCFPYNAIDQLLHACQLVIQSIESNNYEVVCEENKGIVKNYALLVKSVELYMEALFIAEGE